MLSVGPNADGLPSAQNIRVKGDLCIGNVHYRQTLSITLAFGITGRNHRQRWLREFCRAPACNARDQSISPFRQHYDSFDPEILAVLEISFNETWTELQRNGNGFDQALMKTAVADLIMKFASQGESDPQKIKALVMAALQSRQNGL